jgi:hypothetical protein
MEKWNYEMPERFAGIGDQSAWNSTLVTALNCVVLDNNLMHKSTLETLVPTKFKNMIESLILYDNGSIAGKYNVKFTEEDSNNIIIEGCELEILNYKEQ